MLEPWSSEVVAERPASDRPDQVPDGPGGRDGEVGRQTAVEVVAEERDRLARERARCDRTPVDHDDLARGGEDRVDQHQEKDGIEAVAPDRIGDPRRDVADDPGDEHRGMLAAGPTGVGATCSWPCAPGSARRARTGRGSTWRPPVR